MRKGRTAKRERQLRSLQRGRDALKEQSLTEEARNRIQKELSNLEAKLRIIIYDPFKV